MTSLLVVALLVATATPARAFNPPAGPILRVQVIGAAGTSEGTCVLVHREASAEQVVLYFLTARLLFDPVLAGDAPADVRIRVSGDGPEAIETTGRSVSFPAGLEQGLDLAVFKVVTAATTLTPVPISLEAVSVGDPFVIRGYRGGALDELAEHVRFRSTNLVLGDRTAAEVRGIVGAPALVDGRIFGIVTECSATRVPIVINLSAARNFLLGALAGWQPTS